MSGCGEITTLEGLAALYGAPRETSLVKVLDHVSEDYRAFIERAPFLVMATSGPGGLDVSPRGDPAPVAQVPDPRTVAIPDRRGNDRIDSLRNIVADPRVALLFLIPGIGETIRISGRARITTDPELLSRFEIRGTRPRTVILVTAERVYFQCQKALRRARLWEAEALVARGDLPSTGTMLARMSEGRIDGEAYDADYPERMSRTIY